MKNTLIPAGILSCLLYIGCSKADGNIASPTIPAGYCEGVASTYSGDVQPIINTYCQLGTSCHSPGSTNSGGELTDYNKVFAKRIVMKSAIYSGIMPQTGSLTTEQKKKIICWVDSGAANN